MNYKGLLNEYFQKNGLESIIYNNIKQGCDHLPIFKVTVNYNNQIFISENQPNKRLAEHDVAKQILDYININNTNNIVPNTTYIQNPSEIISVFMIDGENLHTLVDTIKFDMNIKIYVYYSKNHSLIDKVVPSYITKCISPSTRNDGCDIYMSMDVMNMPNIFPNIRKIYIFSRDKFASAVVDNFPIFFPNIQIFHETKLPF